MECYIRDHIINLQWSRTAITNTDNLERMYLPITYSTSFLCVMISDWCAENDIGFFQHSVITNSYTTSTFRIKTFSLLFEDGHSNAEYWSYLSLGY